MVVGFGMCGRFTFMYTWEEIHGFLSKFGAALSEESRRMAGPEASYNAAPTTDVPALRAVKGLEGLEARMMRWWLVPYWAKSAEAKYTAFNAKSEEAASKPMFKEPFRRRRCVIPASGFYEWQKLDEAGKVKRPMYITRADGEPVLFAGLWDRWKDREAGTTLESCTILTCEPNEEMREVHDRMPCILEPEKVSGWLDLAMEDPEVVARFLGPAANGVLVMHEVDKRVGNSRVNDARLVERVGGGLFG